MHAVIKTGGKQYRVAPGDTIKVESLAGDVGATIEVGEVLAVTEGASVTLGGGGKVVATIVAHGRRPKVTIFKMRRRKHFKKQAGHRQGFTELRIDSIAA